MKKLFGFALASVATTMACATSSTHASAMINLTAPNSSVTLDGGAILSQVDPSTLGTINSFVTLHTSGMDMIQQGYNTDGRGAIFNTFDAVSAPALTHSISVSDAEIQHIGGTDYRQFLLILNEPIFPVVELDQVKIYLGGSGNELKMNPDNLGTLVWNLDGTTNTSVLLADQDHGGKVDYMLDIPNALFTGGNSNVYVYSQFVGAPGGSETWAVDPVAVPLPSAVYSGLTLMGFAGFFRVRRRIA